MSQYPISNNKTIVLLQLFSFIQMGLFVAIATLIIFDIVKSRNKA